MRYPTVDQVEQVGYSMEISYKIRRPSYIDNFSCNVYQRYSYDLTFRLSADFGSTYTVINPLTLEIWLHVISWRNLF